MTVLTNIAQLVTVSAGGAPFKPGPAMRDLGVVENAAIVFTDIIEWVGAASDLPAAYLEQANDVVDCRGQVVLPGFVDAHTHMVFAGSRAHEFARRLSGVPYTEIAAEGGGILTTVRAVREASIEQIVEIGEQLVQSAIEHGTTTVEIKSGYGLSTESELKLLAAAGALQQEMPIDIAVTFLGAHAIPPEYASNPDAYVDLVIDEMLPLVQEQGIATACDVFADIGFFSRQQSERILRAAADRGFALHVHADEIANIGASQMAAELRALSADHLEYTTPEDMAALSEAGVVGVLLPGTAYTLRLPYPDARTMIEQGMVVAIATDCNPGSCLSENMQLMLSLACANMGMSIEEAITAATLHGAHALRMADRVGSLEVGKLANLVIYDIQSYADIVYHFGVNHAYSVWSHGVEVA